MCGLIVSSDSAFFEKLPPEEARRFFEESKAFLTAFVGAENVLSAMVHLDEKTPHMHFLHVPVTPDGRLNANQIYTRESLKKLQTELPEYLKSRGFNLQRGVEQEAGAAKKHLDTREFKQQQEMLKSLRQEVAGLNAARERLAGELEQGQRQESALLKRLQGYEQQAQEAEKALAAQTNIPQASVLNYKHALKTGQEIIEHQKKALATKGIIEAKNEKLQAEVKELEQKVERYAAAYSAERKQGNEAYNRLTKMHENTAAQLASIEKFFRWNPEANRMHLDYLQEQRREAERKAAEQKRLAQEREQQAREQQEKQQQERQQQAEKERQATELARQQATQQQEHEAQRKQEISKARQPERSGRGMGLSR